VTKAQELEQLQQDMLAMALPAGVDQVIPGSGNSDAAVIFLGHSPSASDNDSGKPYSGPAGDILDDLMRAAGLKRSDIYITNLVKVWTWKDDGGKKVNRTPLVKEIKTWLPFLERELKLLQPATIVALGSTAAQYLLGRDFKITSAAGRWHEVPLSSPYLKQAQLPDPQPLVMGLAQPSYLIHLAENAQDRYETTKSQMIQALVEVRQVVEGKTPQLKDGAGQLPF
jgi:DNA polymerase